MNNEPQSTTQPAHKVASSWPVLWLLWGATATLGWLGVAATNAVLSFSSGLWDPDEIESYLSRPPVARLLSTLAIGAVIGVVFGVLFGLFQWKALRRPRRYAVITVAVTIIGTAILCAMSSTGPAQAQSDVVVALRSAVASGILGGVFCGLCQWLLLIRRLPAMKRWPLMTTIGWAISWTLLLWLPDIPFLSFLAGSTLALTMLALAGGAIVGLLQWLLLRRWLRQAGWWILATSTGWAIPSWLSQVPGLSVWSYVLAGIIPATALVLLLGQQTQIESPKMSGD